MRPQINHFFFLIFTLFPVFTSCGSTLRFEGKVIEASIGGVVLASESETLVLSTLNSDPSAVPGVLIGDVVKVKYRQVEVSEGVYNNELVSLKIVSPSYYRLISGTWLRTGINSADLYGFTLSEDGLGRSVNNNPMQVREWKLDGDFLYLIVDSVFADGNYKAMLRYEIDKLDADSLILRGGRYNRVEWACARQH